MAGAISSTTAGSLKDGVVAVAVAVAGSEVVEGEGMIIIAVRWMVVAGDISAAVAVGIRRRRNGTTLDDGVERAASCYLFQSVGPVSY